MVDVNLAEMMGSRNIKGSEREREEILLLCDDNILDCDAYANI